MNFIKILTIVGSFFVINCVFATSPQLNLTSMNNQGSLNITLKVANFDTIKNVEFHGLKETSVSNREILLNTSSKNKQNNQFKQTLSLMPIKAQTISVYVTAEVNSKKLTSNTVKIKITQDQVKKFQQYQKRQAGLHHQKIQNYINDQIKAQQELFENINVFMKKQYDEILKEQKRIFEEF